jgi:hypothetical protein
MDAVSAPEGFDVRPAPSTPRTGLGSGFGLYQNFTEPAAPAEYYLLEQRRILRGELNYFDHPAFGLLLQITLAPEPESEPEPQTDGPSA